MGLTASLVIINSETSYQLNLRTDLQAQANRLINDWSNTDESYHFLASYNTEGENRGIIQSVVTLFEAFSACRPEALAVARQNLENAISRADSERRADVALAGYDAWNEAADAAYQQVRTVAETTPVCTRG